ncbi:YhdP family protein [Marinobacterium sp. YM272]|uniref:YhdP family protein n=1 Tax=Marinobacterium sp. YM272 TaxID=3421654 RepID=UPI003D7F64E6
MLKASVKHLLWWSLMLAMLLGLVLIGLRMALPKVGDYPEEIAAYVGERLGIGLSIDSLEAQWDGYFPTATLHQIRVKNAGESGPEVRLSIARIDVKLDPWRSLLRLQPIFKQLDVVAPSGIWSQRDGHWLHRPGIGQSSSGLSEQGWSRLLNLLLSQPQVGIRQANLRLQPEQGTSRRLEAVDALLENAGDEHQLSGQLRVKGLGEDSQLHFAVQFQGTPEDPLQGDYPFYLKLDSLGPELLTLVDVNLPLKQLRAGTEFWGRWGKGQLQWLQGRAALGRLLYGEESAQVELSNSTLDFALFKQAEGYQLQLNRIHLNSREQALDLPQLVLNAQMVEGKPVLRRLALPQLTLEHLNAWFLAQPWLPEKAAQALSALSPAGTLANIVLDWESGVPLKAFKARADARDLSVEAYYGAPAIAGASGLVEADLSGGRLHLQSEQFGLHFPRLYDEGWRFDSAGGVIAWSLTPDAALISSELLHLSDDSVSAEGRFSIHIPYSREQQTELTLMIGMRDSDGTQAQRFTPAKEVGQGLHAWLGSAIEAGDVRQAGLVLHGGTRRLEQSSHPSVQLFFDIGQATLNYDASWPKVSDADLFLYLRNGDLRADVRSGTLMNTRVDSGWAYKPLHQDQLQLAFQLQGPADDLNQVLALDPLREVIGDGMADWRLGGELSTSLVLAVPVIHREGGKAEAQVDVRSRLAGGSLVSESLNLQLENLNGNVRFSTEEGLSSDALEGSLFGEPLSGRIETRDGVTSVKLSGSSPVAKVREWSGVAPLRLVSGDLAYDAWLILCNGKVQCGSRFELTSTLQGVAVDLPAGFGLASDAQRSLGIQVPLGSAQLSFDYAGLLKGIFDLSPGPVTGTLSVGAGTPELRSTPGLYVEAVMERLELSDISDLLDRLESIAPPEAEGPQGGAGSGAGALKQVALQVDRFGIGALEIDNVSASLSPADLGWLLQLSGPTLQGQVILPDDDTPMEVALQRLEIVAQAPGAETPAKPASGAALNFDDLPAIDLSVLDLIYKERPLGRWSAQLRPDVNSVRLRDIRGQMSQVSVRGEMSWLRQDEDRTGMTLKIEGQDIGEQLELWGMAKTLDSQLLNADLQLEWTGSPWEINSDTLDGSAQLLLKDGHLIESGNSANLLRVFGILNFNTLGRRLRLDFSDLFEKGVAFDRLAADYRFDNGVASSEAPLLMEGPSANLKASGRIDFNRETVDKDIEVVLPLTSNVPFAAVLLGAPQVAGAVFLIDRLIGDKLEQVTTLRYHLSGDWSDPQVELETAPPRQREEVFR